MLFLWTRNLRHSSLSPSSLGDRGGESTCGVGLDDTGSELYSKSLSSVDRNDVGLDEDEDDDDDDVSEDVWL